MAKFGFSNIVQGVLGNMNEENKESLSKEYSQYLFDNLDSQKIITWSGAQHLRCYIIATVSS